MKALLAFLLLVSSANAVDYPVVCVKSVRPDDSTLIQFPEVFNSIQHPPSDIVIRQPDGTVEVLVSGNGTDALFDPEPSMDGNWVYYVRIPNCKTNTNSQRHHAPLEGADIWRVNVATQQKVRITGQHWTPPGSAGNWSATPETLDPNWSSTGKLYTGYGVINIGPCPIPGKVVFTSNRRGYRPPQGNAFPTTQLFVLDDVPGETDTDGEANRNVECVGFLNVSAALHPVLMKDGRILWSSHESQGLRNYRLWSLWAIYPDGREWAPFYSALSGAEAYHFHGQRTDGSAFATMYYIANNNAFGTIIESPLNVASPQYLDPDRTKNPGIRANNFAQFPSGSGIWRIGTQRRDSYSVTPFTHPSDEASGTKNADGTYTWAGKVTHPGAAPDNGMLVAYSSGPSNNLNRPTNLPRYQMKVGLITGQTAEAPEDIEILLEDEGFNYTQPQALVSWEEVYGAPPVEIPFLPNDSGTPFGIVGSSSAHIGQWKTVSTGTNQGVEVQGFWAGQDIDQTGQDPTKAPSGIDIVALSPRVVDTYGKHGDAGWTNKVSERSRLLARYRFNEPDRPAGDTSFQIKIPADVPFTFRTFDETGRTITYAQTWHQVRPGETRVNCGGCHNHSGEPIAFAKTGVSDPGGTYASTKEPADFRDTVMRTPEFNRDVLPIFEAKCHSCHNAEHPVKLDATIASSIYVVPGMAWKSRLSKAIHGEGDTVQMPKDAEPLSAAEMLLIDEWIDYWCLVAEPGKADFDESPPTLYVSRTGTLKVGAYDYMSGLKSVTVNGEPVTLTNGVYTGPEMQAGETYTVVATDNAGSKTTIERFVRGSSPPDEIAALKARITELEAEVTKQAAKLQRIVEIITE